MTYDVYAEIFNKAFEPFVKLSNPMLDYLRSVVSIRNYAPRQFVTEAGSVEKYFHIVKSGVLAGYLIDQNGNKVVLAFSYPGNFTGVYESFISERPSRYFVESITTSELLSMNRADFDRLFVEFPELLKWRVTFLEHILMGRGQREVEMLTLSAPERFDLFMKRCPEELLQIPQKYLASYLNMKPETFSRMRAKRN